MDFEEPSSYSIAVYYFQSHDKLGRVVCKPTMITAPYNLESGTKLQWYEVSGVKNSKGELLAAFELYEVRVYYFFIPLEYLL
jgi:hypothetical protein